MKVYIASLFLFLATMNLVHGQSEEKFCKAVSKGKFKKIERMVKRKVNHFPESKDVDNGKPGYVQMDENIANLISWFKSMPCVEDAFDDRCQMKIAIYPGWSIIGVKFKTNSGIVEKCFSIQKGTTGTVNIFGWHPKVSQLKNKLVYKVMYDCNGFVEDQKRLCNQK